MADKIVDNLVWQVPPGWGAVDEIRRRIVNGQLQPNEHLVEADLARNLGVGRSTIRAALARLEQEGLVLHVRHRGTRVRMIGKREAVEILEARAMLEALAIRHTAVRARPQDIETLEEILAEMRRRLDSGDLLGVSDQNGQLHHYLVLISEHHTARRLIDGLRSQLVRFQYRTILIPGRSEQSYAEHIAIVEAVAKGDPDRAERAMRAHLEHVADALKQDDRYD